MPVGCLGGGNSTNMNGAPEMDIIVTSSVLNTADQFAFMQQTLLMQIFRTTTAGHQGSSSASSSSSSSGSSSSSSMITCPTCIAFSDQCCQQESGMVLFHEFIEANLHCCVWDQKLSDALANLRYQGYICPGILVMIANSSYLELMADLWKRQLLTAPRGTRISQVGLSTGCVVRPVPLSHTISLHDVLCLILARLKQRGQVADMTTIINAVNQDWSSLVTRMKLNSAAANVNGDINDAEALRDNVHSALGALIKQRKVYYTGNKGYFLVGPTDNSGSSGSTATNGCTSMLFGVNGGKSSSIGSKFSHLRHSLRERSSSTSSSRNGNGSKSSPDTSLTMNTSPKRLMVDQECQADPTVQSPNSSSSDANQSNGSSPNTSFNLERSQSLRISKKSLRGLSKGGSLRLSKKDANVLKQVQEEVETSEDAAVEVPATQATPKSFERKNSFLSKLFSSSSSSSNSSNGKNNKKPKAQLATFSAQFPPPELVEATNAIYQQLIPASQRKQPPKMEVSSVDNSVLAASPQVKVNGGIKQQPTYGFTSTYGYSMLRPPQQQLHPQHHDVGVYSNPPPPLPYRPPPPNPYQTVMRPSPTTVRQSPIISRPSPTNMRPSPTNMSLSPSPATSLQNGLNGGFTPPTYARVSNLKKMNNGNSPSRIVRFADEESNTTPSSSTSSSSGPSSIDSQQNAGCASSRLLLSDDDTLAVIEQSNNELEQKLNNGGTPEKLKQPPLPNLMRPPIFNGGRHPHRVIDTIHNNKNSLAQEVIYEVEAVNTTLPNGGSPLLRSSSQSTLKHPRPNSTHDQGSSVAPSFPSISDLSISDIGWTSFKSLTAQKLMAGLSFNSVDTLLEVNAAAEARHKLNESTETIDFGVI